MKKDYSKWTIKKSIITSKDRRQIFHTRDIWSCYLGFNIGDEEDGSGSDYIRPVIIIRKFNEHICWIIPLTKKEKYNDFYYNISVFKTGYSNAILSQLKVIDANRLHNKIGFIPKDVFKEIQERLKRFLS